MATALHGHDEPVSEDLLPHLSPLGWEHVKLNGDYLWRIDAKTGAGEFSPLQSLAGA